MNLKRTLGLDILNEKYAYGHDEVDRPDSLVQTK